MVKKPWLVAYWTVIATFFVICTLFYRPGQGFLGFIGFIDAWHPRELPVVQAIPHTDKPRGFDGRFYAQLAEDPLLRDPALLTALDTPQFRARRMLFSWTAYLVGLGQPVWILHVYSLQNIVAWLLMAWLLCRWLPPTSGRNFVLWSGCLLTDGWLLSVRWALTDGPTMLLLTAAVALSERGRSIAVSLMIGLAAVGRETGAFASAIFLASRNLLKSSTWIRAAGLAILAAAIPLAWAYYVKSHMPGRTAAGLGHLGLPFEGFIYKIGAIASRYTGPSAFWIALISSAGLLGFVTQVLYVSYQFFIRGDRSAWTWVAGGYISLAAFAQTLVWNGVPGAYSRLTLPLAIATNVLLSREVQTRWWLIVLCNLLAASGLTMFIWSGVSS